VSAVSERILTHLASVGFQTRHGGVTPFGEELPLISGVAWERHTAQVAFVTEAEGEQDEDAWRQLLFAASGLRYHLRGDRPSAFGTPIVLAVVDEQAERVLRALVEELTTRYAVFNRVDLNLVRHRDLADDDSLDTALAPLLPCCRRIQDETISRADVQRFWIALRENVREAARDLDPVFGDLREVAASALADALIESSEDDPDRPAPVPVKSLRLENFRSFATDDVTFEHVTVLHGANGSGKSTVLEALELLWAGTSQRRPPGVSADEYKRHLPRGGDGSFLIRGAVQAADEQVVVEDISDKPRAELPRSVLTQEAVAALVDRPPPERYAQLLAVTGLEVPELEPRTRRLVDKAKKEADAALADAQLAPLRAANVDALKHLRRELESTFADQMPFSEELTEAEGAVQRAANGAYEATDWGDQAQVLNSLIRLDALVGVTRSELTASEDLSESFGEVVAQLRRLAAPRRDAARELGLLLDSIAKAQGVAPPAPPEPSPAMPPQLAVRWSSHARSVTDAARGFRADAAKLDVPLWRDRLSRYADALESAGALTPTKDLEALARAGGAAEAPPSPSVAGERYLSVGFLSTPERLGDVIPALRELHSVLQRHAEAKLASGIERHPAREFGVRAPRVLGAICRFELARHLRRQGPIMRAGEDLLRELLEGRLYPVVRELVAGMVRFEWYFEPLRITVDHREVLIGGLATPRADLDARLLLNSAERTIVGLAWFLALHLLQPRERRRVLVLDDPAGAFDDSNRAGFVATLRAFVRLARPDQVVVATHDDAVAMLLTEELAPVQDWPSAVARVRCWRGADDASVAGTEAITETSVDLRDEEAMLGLGGEPSLFPA
jgi:energy-coupling factor transporter ATP-binding protein EcfA2